MKKIPSVFKRNHDGDKLLRDEVNPGCEWVLAGEGVATRKWDGTSCLVRGGKLFKRYDAKGKTPPSGWEPCEPAGDPVTGHWPGWVPVGDGPEDWLHREVMKSASERGIVFEDGTYELVGPRVNGNPDGFGTHRLVAHGNERFLEVPRTFEGLRTALESAEIEGIVFHHPDGRMAKIKRRDLGLRWPLNQPEESGAVERKAALAWLHTLRDPVQVASIIESIKDGRHLAWMRSQRGSR